jgi:hypothetical protein
MFSLLQISSLLQLSEVHTFNLRQVVTSWSAVGLESVRRWKGGGEGRVYTLRPAVGDASEYLPEIREEYL